MKSNKRISELLVETKAFTDLEEPVILTSGELGIYYVNAEKLCQDGGEFKKYGEDSQAMIRHAWNMVGKHITFGEVIDILSEKVESLLPKDYITAGKFAISGGQRRDWLFSGPVSRNLDLSHIALYKDGKIEVSSPKGDLYNSVDINGLHCVHVADLLTKGSSAYRKENGEEKGWVPMLRNSGAQVNNLLTVVTRLQGGEQILEEIDVNTWPFVAIDKDFLINHSTKKERAVKYFENPTAWSENYLRENGALALIGNFDPDGGKLDRAKKFLQKYENILKEGGRLHQLNAEVQHAYGKSINEILA